MKINNNEYEKHNDELSEVNRQALRGVKHLLLAFAVMVISGVIILNVINSQPETYTVTTKENVVISRMIFPIVKNYGVIVKYRRLDGTVGEFETTDIWFSVGDTIPINISVEVKIKGNE
jgi:hypothetical protein